MKIQETNMEEETRLMDIGRGGILSDSLSLLKDIEAGR